MRAKLILVKCLTVILAFLLLLIVPIVLTLSLPLFLIRFLVGKVAKYVDPNLGKMVNTRGSALAADGVYKRPLTNAVNVIILEGNVDFNEAQELIGQRLSEARFPNGGLRYPELKQYLTTRCGYWFFKDDPNFDFKNHIKLHQKSDGDGEFFTQEDIEDFMEEKLNRKWERERSLWEITFVRNCFPKNVKDSGPHTLIFTRLHHVMGDGYVWIPLLVNDLCQSKLSVQQPNFQKRSFCSSILFGMSFPFRAAYELAGLLIIYFKNLPFKTCKKQSGKLFTQGTGRIALKKLKEIRAYFRVSFSSVLISIVGGAIREFLIKNSRDVPQTLPGITVHPLQNHNEKLRNFITALIIEFPTGEDDPVKRITLSQRIIESQMNSTVPIMLEYYMMLAGSYFYWMLKFTGYNFVIPTGITNIPGPSKEIYFNGIKPHKWVDNYVTASPQLGVCGLAISALSYVEGYRIMLSGDSEVLSKEDLIDLSELIEKHFHILHRLVTLSNV